VTGTDIAIPSSVRESALVFHDGAAALALVHELGVGLRADGLQLRDGFDAPDYETWENVGRAIRLVDEAWQWWIGDWINWGERLFGDDAAAAVGGDRRDRYQAAQTITSREPQTLINIASTCRLVARGRRRTPPLSFSHHDAVKNLEPDEQTEWLNEAVQSGMSVSALRQSIREDKRVREGGSSLPPDDGLSLRDRLQRAADLLIDSAQPLPEGGYEVTDEAMARLREAAGRETRGGG
jgi:hypothetical protein